jgi:hypothetical protein
MVGLDELKRSLVVKCGIGGELVARVEHARYRAVRHHQQRIRKSVILHGERELDQQVSPRLPTPIDVRNRLRNAGVSVLMMMNGSKGGLTSDGASLPLIAAPSCSCW